MARFGETIKNQNLVNLRNKDSDANIEFLENIPKESLSEIEEEYKNKDLLTFDQVFHEPTGYYLIYCFLKSNFSVDKAVFINDVELYKKVRDDKARATLARDIYTRYMLERKEGNHTVGESVFKRQSPLQTQTQMTQTTNSRAAKMTAVPEIPETKNPHDDEHSKSGTTEDDQRSLTSKNRTVSLLIGEINAIGIYGPCIREVRDKLVDSDFVPSKSLFDETEKEVLNDLRMDVFPRFRKSTFYDQYIETKYIERQPVTIKDFKTLRALGRGAYGTVNMCKKISSGKIYAQKVILKKQVLYDKSEKTVMNERDYLALMDSPFVTNLRYALQDSDYLYLIIDIQTGGDLKHYLNQERRFGKYRSAFYAAQTLLGLEHIHSHNIIYRDLKFENILMDANGHLRVADLGLGIKTSGKVTGYAGTPGYIAPEAVSSKPYDKSADFFGFGVLLYRLLSGKKPFERQKPESSEVLNENVRTMTPVYEKEYFNAEAKDLLEKLLQKDPRKRLGSGPNGTDDIKNHPFFKDKIDFGLLEAGYIDAPYEPPSISLDDDCRHPTHVEPIKPKYRKVKITPEFEKAMSSFDYTSVKALQLEIVECMEKRDASVDFTKTSKQLRERLSVVPKKSAQNNPCCVVL